jgi:hypothetical protein
MALVEMGGSNRCRAGTSRFIGTAGKSASSSAAAGVHMTSARVEDTAAAVVGLCPDRPS